MTILVFGASGQVAMELRRQTGDVTALGRTACDLTQTGAAEAAIEAHTPELVINAAAWTAVDKAEENEPAAHQLNAEAPGEMARACSRQGVPFVHISTDYVFDGSGEQPWRETDATAPLGAYGRTKRAGETAVMAAGGQWAILRTAWVFSAHGSNFVKTMLRLSETRDRLTVVADQIGGPTPADAIAEATLVMGRAMKGGQSGGIYHFAGTPQVSWADFARAIFAEAGRGVAVVDIPSSDYPTPAARPANSRLDCGAIARDFGLSAPDWRTGLASVIKEVMG